MAVIEETFQRGLDPEVFAKKNGSFATAGYCNMTI